MYNLFKILYTIFVFIPAYILYYVLLLSKVSRIKGNLDFPIEANSKSPTASASPTGSSPPISVGGTEISSPPKAAFRV